MAGRDGEDIPDAGYGESSRYAAHLDRGWALLDRGDLAAARSSVQHAEEVRPDDPDAAVLLGAIALAEGNADESLRCYDRAIDLDPEYLEPHVAAAQVCLYDLDDPLRALHYCDESLELEGLTPFESLDLLLMAAECELALGNDAAARARLHGLPESGTLEAALEIAARGEAGGPDEADVDRAAAVAFLTVDHDGDPLDEEERVERTARVVQFAMRLARLRVDAGDVEGGLAQLERLLPRFPDEAEAWYLLSEAEHRAGDPRRAAEAGLRTLELDGRFELPRWTPSPAILQRRVVQILEAAPAPQLAELVRGESALPILVGDQPPFELVAEGLDPRVAVLALAGRVPHGPAEESSIVLTGIAVYRRNLVRFARDDAQLEPELRISLYDELAAFLNLDEQARAALGLLPAPTGEPPPAEVSPVIEDPEPEPDKSEKATRRRGRRRSRTLN